MTIVPLIVLLIVAALALSRCVAVVPAGSSFVIERLGRTHRVLGPGLHLVTPFVDRVTARVPSGNQTIDIPAASCTTRDRASVTCSGSVVIRVTDPAVAIAEVGDYRQAVRDLVSRTWTGAVSTRELAAMIDATRGTEAELRQAGRRWGIELVELTPYLEPDDRAMAQLKEQVAQERDTRVSAWLRERGQAPGPDGRPSAKQHADYDEWIALEVRASQREIERARQEAGDRSPAAASEGPAVAGQEPGGITFVVARGSIAAGALGLVEANGRDWTARNVSAVDIARGFRCAVDGQDGETLLVRAL